VTEPTLVSPLTDEEATRLLAAMHAQEERDALPAPPVRLLAARCAYVGVSGGESLPEFLRRAADGLDLAEHEDISYVQVEWLMDEGWAALLVIE